MPPPATTAAKPAPTLRRALGLWLLVFYGLGTIIGAGIYVLVGAVAVETGFAAPLAFVVAGLLAALTGLCYAELSGRFPEASGAAAYVAEGLGSPWMSRVVGVLVLSIGVTIAASLAHGAAGYLVTFLPMPQPLAVALFLIVFTVVACLGVRESIGIAAAMTVVELAGLALVIVVGAPALADLPARLPDMWPASSSVWLAVGGGAFLAFFAFIGFEDLANMAEEAKDPERNMPRAILIAIGASTILYVLVALIVVMAVPLERLDGASAPLALVLEESSWASPRWLSLIALVAIPNGMLVELVMSSRLLYGMARRGLLPAWLGQVGQRTRVPIRATLLAGAAAMVCAVALPFVHLVALTSSLTLIVFLFVSLALWRLHRTRPRGRSYIHAPHWVPPTAALLCLTLLASELLGWLFG